MKYSSYQHSFVILGWLVYWVVVEKCAARQKEIGNHRFQKQATLSKLTSPCWTMRKILSDSGLIYLMGFGAASRPVSLSNFIAFYVFSFFMFMPSFYARL